MFFKSQQTSCCSFKGLCAVVSAMFILTIQALGAKVESIVVATWNAENLFDTVTNHVNGSDGEFTPQSWRRWTPERYNKKLDNMAWVISKIDPDILCMQEVENEGVARDLMARINKTHEKKLVHLAHVDSGDYRGIDNILISRYPVTNVVYSPDGYDRGTLVADVEVDGTTITFFVCHWKSQSGDAVENIAIRTRQALEVRSNVIAKLEENPMASIVIAGDFNENFDDVSPSKTFGAKTNRVESLSTSDGTISLYNLLGDVPTEMRGTYYYARRKVWNTFDSIIVPPTMLAPDGEAGPDWRVPRADLGFTKVFVLPEMREQEDGRPKAFRRVRIKGKPDNYYEEGYSDHFPVVTTLKRATKQEQRRK